jgi:hypothetical protein
MGVLHSLLPYFFIVLGALYTQIHIWGAIYLDTNMGIQQDMLFTRSPPPPYAPLIPLSWSHIPPSF